VKVKVLIALLMAVTTTISVGQQRAKVQARPFHWNAKDWQDLGGDDRVSQLKTLTPAERKEILAALVQEFSPNKGEADTRTEKESLKMAEDTRVKLVDLNGDGIPEVIAQASGNEQCSPTGNCSFWVFTRSDHGLKLILDGHVIQTFTIQPTRTNGFSDLVLGMHGSATDQTLFVYRYVDGRYSRSACYDADWIRMVRDEPQELKNPLITPCRR
jgi:hypothetical protein